MATLPVSARRGHDSGGYYSCFICYSSKDQDFAERLHADLQAKGIRCWFDREDLKIGDPIRPCIDEAIRQYDKLILVLSEHSLASPWVEGEVESALERERRQKQAVLFPIRLDEAVFLDTDTAWAAHIRQTRHIGDFRQWKEHDEYQKAFVRLLRDLKAGDSTAQLRHLPEGRSFTTGARRPGPYFSMWGPTDGPIRSRDKPSARHSATRGARSA